MGDHDYLGSATPENYNYAKSLVSVLKPSVATATKRPTKDELEKMSRNRLATLLKDRGLRSSGMKDALINRLYDGWYENR